MDRRAATALLISSVTAGCTRTARPLADVLPMDLAGVWKRSQVTSLSDIPALISQAGPAESAETTYTGPATVNVQVFRMRSETSAFELMQKWRQSDGIAGYKGPYFMVAHGDQAANIIRELSKSVSQ